MPAGSGAVHVIAVMSEVDGGAVGDDASCGTARDWGRRDARWGAAGDGRIGRGKMGRADGASRTRRVDGDAATMGGWRGGSSHCRRTAR